MCFFENCDCTRCRDCVANLNRDVYSHAWAKARRTYGYANIQPYPVGVTGHTVKNTKANLAYVNTNVTPQFCTITNRNTDPGDANRYTSAHIDTPTNGISPYAACSNGD